VNGEADGRLELELELRRLPGTVSVGFRERGAVVEVQLVLAGDVDLSDVRSRAEASCRRLLHRDAELSIHAPARPARVRLLDVAVRPGETGGEEVEVHLAFGGTRTIGRARAGGAVDAARATVAALERLGAQVPFAVEEAAVLDDRRGDAVVLVFASPDSGARYGAAGGRSVEQAAARATLHALNRHLATQPLAG